MRRLGFVLALSLAGGGLAYAQQQPPVSVGGLIFGQYLYRPSDSLKLHGFDVTRAYLNVTGRFSGGEHLLVDLVPEGGDEGGDSRADLLQNELLGRRLDLIVDFHRPAPGTQAVEGLLPDVAGGVDPGRFGHGSLSSPQRAGRITLPA